MTRIFSFFVLTLALAMFSACGDEHDNGEHDDDHGHSQDDGDHHHEDGDHDHKDGDHDHDGDHDDGGHGDHGDRHELGSATAGAFKVTVALFGDIAAGKEAVLDIDVEGGKVGALRTWVGSESGTGSMKAKLDGEDGSYHGHLEVPAKLANGSAIWVEVEDIDGKRSATSFTIP